MIAPTYPEPLCDIAAQLRVLADPMHPKAAMWLSRDNVVPARLPRGMRAISTPTGTLLTGNIALARRFLDAPDDDTLAGVLGYVEPKSHIVWRKDAVIVQACDERGSIVQEMMASAPRLSEAIDVAAAYGDVMVLTVADALQRRMALRIFEGNRW